MFKILAILAVIAAVHAGNYGPRGPGTYSYSHTHESKPIIVREVKVVKPVSHYVYEHHSENAKEETKVESSEGKERYAPGPHNHGYGYGIPPPPKIKAVKVEKVVKPVPIYGYGRFGYGPPHLGLPKEEKVEESSDEKRVIYGPHPHGYPVPRPPKVHVVEVEKVVKPGFSYGYGRGYKHGHHYVPAKEEKKEEEKAEESSEEKKVRYGPRPHGYGHGYIVPHPLKEHVVKVETIAKPARSYSYGGGHHYGHGYGHGHHYGPAKEEKKEEKEESSEESSEEKTLEYGPRPHGYGPRPHGYGHRYVAPHPPKIHVVKVEKNVKPVPSHSYGYGHHYGHGHYGPAEEEQKKDEESSEESSEEKTVAYGPRSHVYGHGYIVPHPPKVNVIKVIKPAPSYSYGHGYYGYGYGPGYYGHGYGYGHHSGLKKEEKMEESAEEKKVGYGHGLYGPGYGHGYGYGVPYGPILKVANPPPSYSYGHGYGHSYAVPAAVKKVVVEEIKVAEPVVATPYKFGYDIVDKHGNKQSRQESGDAAGNKKGSYTIDLVDGRKRIVDYVADGNGFKAVVRSNEPGTDPSQDPADVQREPLGPPLKVVESPKAPEPVKVVESPKVPEPVKVVKVAPKYGYGIGHYGHGNHGYGHGHGYHGYGYGHGGYSKVYNRFYDAPRYYYGPPAYSYKHSYGPSYSYGNTYAPAGSFRYWW